MYLIDFETVYEVKLRRLGSPQTETQYYELPLELIDRQKGVTLNETYRISRELLTKIDLSTSLEEPIMRRMLKFRKRFGKTLGEEAVYKLEDDDSSLFNPVQANYDQIDRDLARIIYSYFYLTSNPHLEVSDLDISLPYERSAIGNRVKFFIQFGFLEWTVGQHTIVNLVSGGLRALKDYIEDSNKDSFRTGNGVRFSGTKDVVADYTLPAEVGAFALTGQSVTLEKVETSRKCQYIIHEQAECGEAVAESDNFCILHSTNPNKDSSAFKVALQSRFLYSAGESVELIGITFPDCNWSLGSQDFGKNIVFSHSKFLGILDFRRKRFAGSVIFKQCIFAKEVWFQEAHFFQLRVDYANFEDKAIFDNCTITGPARIVRPFSQPKYISLKDVILTDRPNVELRGIRMEGVSLLGTNIRGVRMVDLSFPFKGFALLWGRYLAGDEPRPSRLIEFGRRLKEAVKAKRWQSNPKSSVDYQSLAVLYRDLQANYTDSGDYARANWFFVSEKEMEWKRRNWWRHVFSLHTYYWLFSNFGQSLLLPVLWILLVVPIFTLIMIHVGDIDGISWSATGNFRIFLDACVKNFTMVFNRPLVVMYLAKYPWSQLLNIVETGAVLSLLSLIVVAARRRLSNRNL